MESSDRPGRREASAGYFPVHIDSLDQHARELDLYLKHPGSPDAALYRAAGVPFTSADARRLADQGVNFLYVPMRQHGIYRKVLREKLERTFHDSSQSRAERGRVVRAACTKMIEEVMLFPGRPEAVSMVAEISQSFAKWTADNRAEFGYLLDMSAHDYVTTAHMVNVGVGCGLLYRRLCPDAGAQLAEVIQGGLLRDVGKRGVPEEVLNKEGKLDPEEWELMRAHPMKGYDELRANAEVPATVLEMTRDHHEKLDGSGYPAGRAGDQISFHARICAVVDVYDAITAARPYRGPTPPAQALEIMGKWSGPHLDPRVFDAWKSMVEELIREDPERAVPGTDKAFDESRPESGHDGERRQHARRRCDLSATGRLLRKGKPGGPDVGQDFALRVEDFSRGGLLVRTPFPLTINDILSVDLAAGGEHIQRLIKVVRVRAGRDGNWLAGGYFVTEGNASAPGGAGGG